MSNFKAKNLHPGNAGSRRNIFKMIALGFFAVGATQVGAGVVREYAPPGPTISLSEEYAAASACNEKLASNQPCSLEQQKALSEVASNEVLMKKGAQKLLVAALLL
jgi:hypothetical protein